MVLPFDEKSLSLSPALLSWKKKSKMVQTVALLLLLLFLSSQFFVGNLNTSCSLVTAHAIYKMSVVHCPICVFFKNFYFFPPKFFNILPCTVRTKSTDLKPSVKSAEFPYSLLLCYQRANTFEELYRCFSHRFQAYVHRTSTAKPRCDCVVFDYGGLVKRIILCIVLPVCEFFSYRV